MRIKKDLELLGKTEITYSANSNVQDDLLNRIFACAQIDQNKKKLQNEAF